MRTIFQIFLRDCRNIGKNVVALIVVMGLSVLPSLYAWFNILSNWDPYGPEATGNIKVAVAYDDAGVTIENVHVNISEKIVDALGANNTIGWVFTDTTSDAIEGVWSGDYYAALIMPEDFSKNMVSFLTDNMTHPQIIYYTNQKKNAIAPKITDKAKTAVREQVNATFVSTLTETLLKSANAAQNLGITGDDVSNAVGSNTSSQTIVDLIIAKLKVACIQVDSFDTMLTALSGIIDTAGSTGDTAENIAPDLSGTFETEKALLAELQKSIGKSSLIDTQLFGQIYTDISSVQDYMKALSDIYQDVGYNIDDFNHSIENIGINITDSLEMIHNLQNELNTAVEGLEDFRASGTYSLLKTAVSFNSDELSTFVSAPVSIETVDLYPIENYGSAMAPFYSVLAIWVGALILVAIIHVQVKPFSDGRKITSVQAFFGRYLTFFLIGQAQALLITLGNLFYIGIQCRHPLKLWFASAFTAFVFTMITYSLTVAFENVGEAAAVVIMVIQVAGAGGTFPIQCLPPIYQAIYQYLPFTYAMDALRECVGGTYNRYYWECILCLGIYVVISLVIGLLVAIPCRKLNGIINKSKEKSGIMI